MADDIRRIQVDLSGRVAIVTGASRGIGKSIALRLGEAGAQVACAARNMEKLAETVAAIESAGGKAAAFSCDVTSRESVDEFVEKVAQDWGRLDIVVNNAGITKDTLIPRMSDEDFDSVIATNLRSVFLFTRAATQVMMRSRYGRIINISSVSGLMGNPGQANYSASKAGVIAISKSIAKETATENICVNSVAPTVIRTPILEQLTASQVEYMTSRIPRGRTGTVEEVAAVVHFLASPDCSFVTGQCYDVSGGRATY